jgi:hypothetical protein
MNISENKINISILGSCVSRDIFDMVGVKNVQVQRYVARTSLISLFSPKFIEPTIEMLNSEKWRDRMQVLDLNKTGLEYLFAEKFDFLLIDFVDERLGITTNGKASFSNAPFADDVEFMKAHADLRRVMPLHGGFLAWWQKALLQLAETIKERDIEQKIILNKIFLATEGSDKHPVAGIDLQYVAAMNNMLRSMYEAFEQALPNARNIEYDDSHLLVDAKHKWGAAPFHYELLTYKIAANKIANIISSDK